MNDNIIWGFFGENAVKRAVILISMLFLALCVLIPALCGFQQAASAAEQGTGASDVQPPAQQKADANAPADPNAGRRRRSFEGLEEALENLEPENQAEIREWMAGEVERKVGLMEAVHNRRTVEYKLLRELAVKEGAEETVAAIDRLTEKSDARYEGITKRLGDERRRARREQLQEKREERHRRREERRRSGEERRRSTRRSSRDSDTDY